jgi:restriction system protein
VTVPNFQDLTLPVLESAADQEVRVTEVVDKLADRLQLSTADRTQLLPSGRQTVLANRIGWAKTYLSKAGLLELTRRAYFRITEEGRQVLASPPERIDIAYLNRFPRFREFTERSNRGVENDHSAGVPVDVTGDDTRTPDEILRTAHRQMEAALAAEILQRIRAGTPAFFERLIVLLLIAMGYGGSVTEVDQALVGGTGDNGVDGIIDQDPLGLDRIYVQAKRYAEGNTVGSGAIRDFFGSLDRFKASKGLFVATSTFSPSARETAEHLSKRIVLIDGDKLAHLMIQHNVGCRIEETFYSKTVDEEFFE